MNMQTSTTSGAGFVLAALVLAGCAGLTRMTDAPQTTPGISRSLAAHRRATLRNPVYRLDLELESGATTLRGRCVIDVDVVQSSPHLVLDFKGRAVSALAVDGTPRDFERRDDHLIVAAEDLAPGRHGITIDYETGIGRAGEGLLRVVDADDGSEYVYTLNVPADGHAVLPCFDQPDLKGRFQITLTTPTDWTVVTNAPLQQRSAVGGTRARHVFATTAPISTYLFAFAAGPFVQVTSDEPGRPLRVFGRRSQRELLAHHAPALFDRHRAALRFLEDYFARPYPFAKLDFVCVPDFPFGGMEHPGAIFYGEDGLLFRSEVTRLREAERADLIAHEVAHMWFGDLVTMPWFDDVWLKEGFATFMAHKVLAATLAGIDHDQAFVLRNFPAALDIDMTRGATPIRQPLENLDDAKSNYGPIIYRKGPAVLRQLEALIGKQAFRAGVRRFLTENAYDCGDWQAFRSAFEAAWRPEETAPLATWSAAWIEGAGAPRVVAEPRGIDAGKLRIAVRQRPCRGGGTKTWPLRLAVGVHEPRDAERLPVILDAPETTCMASRPERARDVILHANDDGVAYALVALDPASRATALARWHTLDDPLFRTLLWESLWLAVLETDWSPADWFEHARRNVFREDSERLVRTLLARMARVLALYLDEPTRQRLGGALEADLQRAITDPALPKGHRLLAFRALFSVTTTRGGADFLVRLLDGAAKPLDVTVSNRDRWRMVTRLMTIADPRANAWLRRMRARDPGDEGRRRAFLVDCARPNRRFKETLFRRFREDRDLPERWVQNGARHFFAPEQAEIWKPLLRPALDDLDWIKHNRKIFFLADWVAACVRQGRDAEASQSSTTCA